MGNKKQRIIPAHYSWNSSIFTRGVVDPIKRRLGWIDESERPVSLKESATGQELDRMKETAKDAGKLVATGLAFGNPVTTSSTIAPLITGSQAYFMTGGLKDAYNRITSSNKTAADGAMVALDVAGAVPGIKPLAEGTKVLGNYTNNIIKILKTKGLDTLYSNPKIVGKGNVLGYQLLKETPIVSEIKPETTKVIYQLPTTNTNTNATFRLGIDRVPPTPETHLSKFRTIYPTEYNTESLSELYTKNMLKGANSRGDDAYISHNFIHSLSNSPHYGIGNSETGYITGIPIAQGRGLLPTHIAPTGLKGSLSMIKELSSTREPVVMAVTPDISSMAERVGFKNIGTIEQPFGSNIVTKNIIANANTALEDIPLSMTSNASFKLAVKPSIKIGHRHYFSNPTSHYIGQNQYVNPSEVYIETNPEIIAQDREFLKKVNAYYKSKKYIPLDLNLSKYGTDVVNNAVKDRITQHLTTIRGVRPRTPGNIIPEQLEHDATYFVPMNSTNNGGRVGVSSELLNSDNGILYSSASPNHTFNNFMYKVARPTNFSGPRESWMTANEPLFKLQENEYIPTKVFRRIVKDVTGKPIEQWQPYQKLIESRRKNVPNIIQSYVNSYQKTIKDNLEFLDKYFEGNFKYNREFKGMADAKALQEAVKGIKNNFFAFKRKIDPKFDSYEFIHNINQTFPTASSIRKEISASPYGYYIKNNPDLFYPGAFGKRITEIVKKHRQKTPTLSKYTKQLYGKNYVYRNDQHDIKELQQYLDLSKYKNGNLLYTGKDALTYIGTPETQGFRIISVWPQEASNRLPNNKIGSQDAFISRNFKQGGILKRVESGKSGIHIKPENRGKFTALKKRTGKSSTWYKEHGTPAQKKMAVFALNARKWKHK